MCLSLLRQLRLGRVQSTGEGVLSGDTLNTMEGVQVLVEDDLVAGGTTLAGGDGRVRKEVLPDSEPPATVLCLDLLLVTHPVSVPSPESSAVVNCGKKN